MDNPLFAGSLVDWMYTLHCYTYILTQEFWSFDMYFEVTSVMPHGWSKPKQREYQEKHRSDKKGLGNAVKQKRQQEIDISAWDACKLCPRRSEQ